MAIFQLSCHVGYLRWHFLLSTCLPVHLCAYSIHLYLPAYIRSICLPVHLSSNKFICIRIPFHQYGRRHSSVSVNLFKYKYLPRCSSMSACLFFYLPTYSSVFVYLFIKFHQHVRHYMSHRPSSCAVPICGTRDMVELWFRPVTPNCTVFKNRSHLGYIKRLWRVPWEAANPPQ